MKATHLIIRPQPSLSNTKPIHFGYCVYGNPNDSVKSNQRINSEKGNMSISLLHRKLRKCLQRWDGIQTSNRRRWHLTWMDLSVSSFHHLGQYFSLKCSEFRYTLFSLCGIFFPKIKVIPSYNRHSINMQNYIKIDDRIIPD